MPKRIVVDTGIARELCYSTPPWFSDFIAMRQDDWTFHLSDIAIAELIATRERSGLSEDQWAAGAARLDKILGDFFPCLPGKRELFHLCGFTDDEDPDDEHLSAEFLLKYSRAIWKTVKLPLATIENGAEVIFSVGPEKFRCPLKLGAAAQVLDEERGKWIAEMSRDPKSEFDYSAEVNAAKAYFDSWTSTDGQPMSVRGEILAHARAEFERRLANGYNPASSKRRNDGIDFLLHFAFLWPALLVTTDKWLCGFLRGLDSFQADWTFLPEHLAAVWRNGKLTEPDWPDVIVRSDPRA